jgi:hypothetical protein
MNTYYLVDSKLCSSLNYPDHHICCALNYFADKTIDFRPVNQKRRFDNVTNFKSFGSNLPGGNLVAMKNVHHFTIFIKDSDQQEFNSLYELASLVERVDLTSDKVVGRTGILGDEFGEIFSKLSENDRDTVANTFLSAFNLCFKPFKERALEVFLEKMKSLVRIEHNRYKFNGGESIYR